MTVPVSPGPSPPPSALDLPPSRLPQQLRLLLGPPPHGADDRHFLRVRPCCGIQGVLLQVEAD